MTANSSKLLYQRSGTAKSLAGRSGEQHTTIGGKHAKKFGRHPVPAASARAMEHGDTSAARDVSASGSYGPTLISIAVHIDHQHEHAVRILILPCRE